MTSRSIGSRIAVFAFVFALLLKGAVPLFATWSAQLQGKGVAEVCDVYGVALPGHAGHAGHDMHAMHGMHAMHDMPASTYAMPADPAGESPHHHDDRHAGGDHCVLGGLVAFAGVLVALPTPPAASSGELLHTLAWHPGPSGADASARWAALVGHGPPALS